MRGCRITWKTGSLSFVSGDPTLLREVTANRLANALTFTRLSGTAKFEIGVQPTSDHSSETVIFVRDNGAGFDPTHAEKLVGVTSA